MRLSILVFIIASLLCIRCNDPAFFDTDLLKQDEINIKYVDSFTIHSQTLRDTGFIVPFNITKLPVGHFDDPIFGTTEASIFFQFRKPFTTPSYTNSVLDSVFLFMAIDTLTEFYGQANESHNLEVHEMSEGFNFDFDYKAGYYDLPINPIVHGRLTNYVPDRTFRPMIIEPSDTFTYDPVLAFNMGKDYGNKILRLDSLNFNSDSIFFANVRGLVVKQTNKNRRMISCNLQSTYSRMQIIYRQQAGDTTSKIDFYTAQSSPHLPLWKHTHSPLVQQTLNEKIGKNELILLQGLSGLKTKLEFPNLRTATNAIVNKAELELTVISLPGDDLSVFSPCPQLALYRKDETGREVLITDQGGSGFNDYVLLGGSLLTKEENGIKTYRYILNISNHIQRIISGKEPAEVYIKVAPKSLNNLVPENLSRVVLGGPGHPLYPAKLKISYTTY